MNPDIFLYILCIFFGLLVIPLIIFAHRHDTRPTTIQNNPPTRTQPGKTCSRIINWQNRFTSATNHTSNNSINDIEMQSSNLAPGSGSEGRTDDNRDYTTNTTPTEYILSENIVRTSNQGKMFERGSCERLRPGAGG
ncbi:MAG: hypothetical protein Q9184_005424 [Pyrenodesmia sp. 2 TL-2023]